MGRPKWYGTAGSQRSVPYFIKHSSKKISTKSHTNEIAWKTRLSGRGALVNYELRIINYELRIINYELRIINYELRVINYELRISNDELRITKCKITNDELRITNSMLG